MQFDLASALGVLFGLSEFGLSLAKRAKRETANKDQGSLALLWLVIVPVIFLAFFFMHWFPGAAIGHEELVRPAGVAVFAAGLALRWYAIIHLGRFFTVNVAIASDHRVVDTGPYRYIRHPSYTGSLMAFLGIALCIGNWVSLAVMFVPITAVFMRRIRVEESALELALGESYREYSRRTKRLVPAIF